MFLVTVNGVRERLWPVPMETDHRFIADAIEYYRLHPQYRSAIGSVEEHRRLDQALREWYVAYEAYARSRSAR